MKLKRKRAAVMQYLIQAVFLVLFLVLTFSLGAGVLPADLIARLDPLMAAALPIVNRTWMSEVIPGLVILASALLLGRIFCGYACPMGTTLDIARAAFRAMLYPFRRRPKADAALNAALTGPQNAAKQDAASAKTANVNPDDDNVVTRGWFQLKYMALAIILVTALLGVNTLVWGAPLLLITRFYLLLLEPALRTVGQWGLESIAPLLDGTAWAYVAFAPRFYSGFTFLAVFFGGLFILELVRPRFWCRYFCPAGALLGLLGRVAPWRRRVKKCVSCGACAKICPTQAISADGLDTARCECIVCRACSDVCPVSGIAFTIDKRGELAPLPLVAEKTEEDEAAARALSDLLEAEKEAESQARKTRTTMHGLAAPDGAVHDDRRIKRVKDIGDLPAVERPFSVTWPSRRAFLGASAMGALLGFVHVASAKRLLSRNTGRGARPLAMLRPPGALPEQPFLLSCTRCGLCMKACPTNGLQPAWGTAWIEDIFSPVLVPRSGPCEPGCNACGQVCPTRAIAPLPLEQKQWAKMGTAEVVESRCLAFAENRACVVCQEVCPFGAVDLVRVPNVKVAVPKVNQERCFGCGYCEYHCPTARPAIIAKADGALRLEAEADYPATAKAQELDLVPGRQGASAEQPDDVPEGRLPPGFVPAAD